MRSRKIIYYSATTLLSVMMLFSAGMYLLNNQEVAYIFESFGYPRYLVIPLAVAKLLGLAAIWSNFSPTLKEWAYAGFFFDFVLAFLAHLSVADGQWPGSVAAITFLIASRVSASNQSQ